VRIVNLGYMEYDKALQIQERLHQKRVEGVIGDVLLIVEHPPVLTLGKRGEYSNILMSSEFLEEQGIKIYNVNRGGDVTYHGPGQIVGYPIVGIKGLGKDVRRFVEGLEDVFINLLREHFAIEAHREDKKYTGVWVGDEKITAIGIAVKSWVTMHGFAFNVNTDLDHFRWINPCGITNKGVTSLKKLTGQTQDMAKITNLVVDSFCQVFEVNSDTMEFGELEAILNGD